MESGVPHTVGPIKCEGCEQIRDEVVCIGHSKNGAIWRCAECEGEINQQMAKGVDKPAPDPVELKSARKQATKQEETHMTGKETVGVEMKQGITSQATFVLDGKYKDGMRLKGDRAAGGIFGPLYVPAEIAGKSTKFKVTIEAVN